MGSAWKARKRLRWIDTKVRFEISPVGNTTELVTNRVIRALDAHAESAARGGTG
jgi:hypothetical protein